MRTILIQPDIKGVDEFIKILSAEITEFHITSSIEDVELHTIEVVIMWLHVPDLLSELPNLKLLLNCGSGVDHIITSPNLPHNIPLIRLVDPFLQNHVSDYIVEQIFKHFFPEIHQDNRVDALCRFHETVEGKRPRIGIMGLGLVGSSTAEKLLNMGFEVCGWVKTSKHRSIQEVYVGNTELETFAKKCEVIICQLPLTQETKEILNARLFSFLPNGAFLINVGRGEHLNEADLLLALEDGKLSGACLDVLKLKPLPLDHPFRANPKIKITPHIAGYIGPETQAPYAARIISSFYNEEKVKGAVNYSSLY
jgi:glyoxylate/hydroxypyruvate reductase